MAAILSILIGLGLLGLSWYALTPIEGWADMLVVVLSFFSAAYATGMVLANRLSDEKGKR